jgi:hypothetical protein
MLHDEVHDLLLGEYGLLPLSQQCRDFGMIRLGLRFVIPIICEDFLISGLRHFMGLHPFFCTLRAGALHIGLRLALGLRPVVKLLLRLKEPSSECLTIREDLR